MPPRFVDDRTGEELCWKSSTPKDGDGGGNDTDEKAALVPWRALISFDAAGVAPNCNDFLTPRSAL